MATRQVVLVLFVIPTCALIFGVALYLGLSTSEPARLRYETVDVRGEQLIAGLQGPDPVVRRNSARDLGSYRGSLASETVTALAGALEDPDVDVQRWAALSLDMQAEALHGEAGQAVGALEKALADDGPGADAEVRALAADALGHIGSEARSAIPTLRKALEHQSSPASVGAVSGAILPALPRGPDRDWHVRARAALALWRLDRQTAQALEALSEVLQDGEEPLARAEAAEALGLMGGDARPQLAALQAKRNDPSGVVRVQAALALWRIDRQREVALKVLGEALQDQEAVVRGRTVEALGNMGPDARPMLPAVAARLRDTVEGVRTLAAGALRQIDPAYRP